MSAATYAPGARITLRESCAAHLAATRRRIRDPASRGEEFRPSERMLRRMDKRANIMGISLAMGIAIGAALGAATDNVGLGIALGVAIGAAIGTARSANVPK